MKYFVRGDLDGFLGVGLDNVVQLLIVVGLCQAVLGFSAALIYQSILPAIALSYLVGNLFYAREAWRLGRRENRTDVCALPYGLNTPILIAFAFLVMLPARNLAAAAGAPDPAHVAWQTGIAACFFSGTVEILIAFAADWLAASPRRRRCWPRSPASVSPSSPWAFSCRPLRALSSG